jgi:hypothetical protein
MRTGVFRDLDLACTFAEPVDRLGFGSVDLDCLFSCLRPSPGSGLSDFLG